MEAQNDEISHSLSEIDISLLSKSKASCIDVSSDIKDTNLEYYTQFLNSIEDILNKNTAKKSKVTPRQKSTEKQYESVKPGMLCIRNSNIIEKDSSEEQSQISFVTAFKGKVNLLEENNRLLTENIVCQLLETKRQEDR